jgi:pimeloyl-ACP methyl ester carboxylesterase
VAPERSRHGCNTFTERAGIHPGSSQFALCRPPVQTSSTRQRPVRSVLLVFGGILTAAIVGTGIWAWTPDRLRSELEKLYWDPSTRYIEVGGTSIRVRESGDSHAPAVVLLHGFGSSLETWEPWAQALSTRYRVLRFDFPGSGLSEPDRSGSYTDARSLELIVQLMDKIGLVSATLIGNSMGGRIAWRFAAAFPSRVHRLILISPDGFASPGFEYGKPPHVPLALQLMKHFLPRVLMRNYLATAYADPSRLSDSVIDRYYDLLLAPGNRAAMISRMQQNILEEPGPILRQIRTPALLLWGRKDRLIPFSNSADYVSALPNVRLVEFPDLGHVPHEEAPGETLRPVEQFLAQ